MSNEAEVNCDGDSSSVDEFDNNKSFVKKVKSRVSGFIPTSLSKWFATTKVRQRDELDDDEEDTYDMQPPTKRVKKTASDHVFDMNVISTPLHSHNQQHNPFSITTNNNTFREPIPGPSNIPKARKLVLPSTSNHYNQIHMHHQIEQTNGVDSDSGESTSGYSSMPRIGSKEQVSEMPERTNAQAQITKTNQNRSIFNTSIPHERSLFGHRFTSPQKINSSLSTRRPSFNASAFGTPNFMDKTLSTRRIVNSPFYSGRITYGGASAYARSILNTSPEQVPHAVQPKLVNEKSATLSRTAKRILDTLEQYTSPVQDVRRIPLSRRTNIVPTGLIGKYVGANPYTIRESKVASNRELQVPTMTDLLKMKLKERLQDSTDAVREIASNSSSPLNAEQYSIRTHDDDKPLRSTNKIKTKVASARQKGAVEETVPEVKLPDVQLPISTLPSFNFSIPAAKPSKPVEISTTEKTVKKSADSPATPFMMTMPKTTSPIVNFKSVEIEPATSFISKTSPLPVQTQSPQIQQELKQLQQVVESAKENEYKFSKPLIIAENLKSIKAINNFKFSKPLVKKAVNGISETLLSKPEAAKPAPQRKSVGGFGDLFKMGADKWECSACMVCNENTTSTCVSCTTPKPATKLNGPKVDSVPPVSCTNTWGDKFKAPSNTWECSMCMVRNDSSKQKCIACESLRQPSTVPITVSTPVTSKGFESFKKNDNEWECTSCMVRNQSIKPKCVCCEALKPGSVAPPTISITSSWGDKFKAPSSTWECSMCFVRNELSKEKCAACENPRPAGLAPKPLEGFAKKVDEWECTSCMVRNPSSKQRCVCCEAPKPGAKTAPSAQPTEVPKFSLGIENGLINGHGFMFGIPADKNKTSVTAKKEEKSEIDSGTPSIFGNKAQATQATETTQFSFGVKSNGAKAKLPTSTVDKTDKPSETTTTPTPIPAFSFGVPGTPTTSKKRSNEDAATVDAPKKISFPVAFNGELKDKETSERVVTIAKPVRVEPPKYSFGPSAASTSTSTSTFAFASTTPKTTTSLVTTEVASKQFSFGSTSNTEKSASTIAPPVFGQPAAPTTTTASSSAPMFAFGANKATPTPMFNADKPTTNGPMFNFSSPTTPVLKPKTANSKPTTSTLFGFGGSTPAPALPFGGPPSNTFGSPTPAPTSTATSAPSFGASTFGSNSAQSMTFGSLKADPPAAGPTFGSSSSISPFGSAAAAAPAGTSTFGKAAPASNGIFSFGTGPTQAPAEAKPTFNFGSNANSSATPPTGGFSFGAPATTTGSQPSNGGFNFGSNASVPSFNAESKPSFNFTAGVASPSFSAQSDTKPGRVIRRAIRRTQQR